VTPKEIELLSELTIVIQTYNRPLQLERSIEYWRDFPVKVIILDGSEKACLVDGLQPNTQQIFYYSFPTDGESNTENWARRIRFGVGLMTTRFSALCCDDDVYTISGLVNALELLDEGAVDAVAGKTGEYAFRQDSIVWVHKYPHWKDEDLQKSDNLRERLFFDGGAQAFYAIYKTEKLKAIHTLTNLYRFPITVWYEQLITTVTRVFCRIKFLDELFWLKCSINYPEAKNIKFAQLFWDENFAEYKDRFVECLDRSIKFSEPKIPESERTRIVLAFAEAYTRPKRRRKIEVKAKAQVLSIIGSLPLFLRSTIFAGLPKGLKKRIGNSNFEVNFKPTVLLTEQDLINKSLKDWERILLMPREELRLRANI
jgi:hypothetical protein